MTESTTVSTVTMAGKPDRALEGAGDIAGPLLHRSAR